VIPEFQELSGCQIIDESWGDVGLEIATLLDRDLGQFLEHDGVRKDGVDDEAGDRVRAQFRRLFISPSEPVTKGTSVDRLFGFVHSPTMRLTRWFCQA